MTQRTTFVLTVVLLGLVILGRTEVGIAGGGIRIGQATHFATLDSDVKFPEGIAADVDGRIYVSTFAFDPDLSFIVKLGRGGQERQRTAPIGAPLLGLAFNADGDLFTADFGNGRILRILNGDLSNAPEVYATLPCCNYLPPTFRPHSRRPRPRPTLSSSTISATYGSRTRSRERSSAFRFWVAQAAIALAL
jgi:hypothetical protein